MKKIFFTTVVAAVAIGGAIAQISAEDKFGNAVTCDEESSALCRSYPGGLYYPGTDLPISHTVLIDLLYNP